MGLTSGTKMAAAVGFSLKCGFPATALGRVGLQVSPGAVVQWGAVPVTEAAWVERRRRGGRSPAPGLRGGLTCTLLLSILSDCHPALLHCGRVAAGRRLEKIMERQRSGRTSEPVKVV